MKKTRLLIIAVAAVLLLAAAFVLVTREPKVPESEEIIEPDVTPAAESEAVPQENLLISLIDLDIRNIDTIEVDRAGEEKYTLIPFGEGTFKVADAPGVSLMTSAAQSIRFSLILFTSNDIVSEGENIADFGLDNPEAYCTITAGEDRVVLILGDKSPDGAASYIMREGDPNVYLVQGYLTDMLFANLYSIREKTLPLVNVSALTGISVKEKGTPKYTITRYTSDDPFDPGLFPFYYTYPYDPPKGVNDSKLFEILEIVQSGLFVYEFIDSPESLEEYGLDDMQALELEISAEDGTGLHLLLGNTTDEGMRYVLRAGTASPVMLISASDAAVADINPFKYAESFAALVGIDAIRGFVLTIGEMLIEGRIERTGNEEDPVEEFFIDNQKIEEDLFKDFYQVLIGRQVEGDAESDIVDQFLNSEPVFQLKYISRDDEFVVKDIEFYPYNDDFYVLQIDGGSRRFLIGQYQVDYIVEQARIFQN
ncbi:MAG: DUF4340 domain-containing protein [Bacteroidetes bacterium]|nr:DUF4340 domain-containing protein [Bacteroidota bacterium]